MFATYDVQRLELFFHSIRPLQIETKMRQSIFVQEHDALSRVTQLFQQSIDFHHNFAILPLTRLFIVLNLIQWKF